MFPFFFAIPGLALALVVWAAATRRLVPGPRFAALAAIVLLTCGLFDAHSHRRHHRRPVAASHGGGRRRPKNACSRRPQPSPRRSRPRRRDSEQPALPRRRQSSRAAAAATAAETPANSGPQATTATACARRAGSGDDATPTGPAFAGPTATASFAACGSRPTGRSRRRSQMWRRPIGPGWSSFAVRGDLLYTQEQRGDDEVVACYKRDHRQAGVDGTATRSGSGSRTAAPVRAATPTLSDGRVYTFGATGILNALDAGTGAVVWSRNAATDTGVEAPGLGLRRLAAGRRRPRRRRRRRARSSPTTSPPASRAGSAQTGGGGYSSPHLVDDRRRRADPAAERQPARPASRRPTARCCGSTRGRATASCSRP